ncbi:hypothetical protein CCACVL1_03498, partial [Corchorus capsularis]
VKFLLQRDKKDELGSELLGSQ